MKEIIKISASDGFPIAVTSFTPKRYNGKVILINSATGVKQTYYHEFATWLTEQGFRVYTYDYRGIGESKREHLKGFQATMEEWGTKDYHGVLKYLFLAFPDSQFTVIGHSVGGQIIGMSPLSENVDVIVNIGAQTPYWKNYDSKFKLFTFWNVLVPFFTKVFGYFPAKRLRLFEDLPSGVALQWARWAKSENYVFDENPGFKDRFKALHQPALMVSFTDDEYAPKNAVEQLMSFFKNLKWTHIRITPEEIAQNEINHFGFFKKTMTTSVWYDVMNWTNRQLEIKASKAA
jgi:predicted alpha/beta hydrolase